MTYDGFIKKSRTLDLAGMITVLGAIMMGVPQLGLSQSTAGIVMMVCGVLVAYLRHITTGPVE